MHYNARRRRGKTQTVLFFILLAAVCMLMLRIVNIPEPAAPATPTPPMVRNGDPTPYIVEITAAPQ